MSALALTAAHTPFGLKTQSMPRFIREHLGDRQQAYARICKVCRDFGLPRSGADFTTWLFRVRQMAAHKGGVVAIGEVLPSSWFVQCLPSRFGLRRTQDARRKRANKFRTLAMRMGFIDAGRGWFALLPPVMTMSPVVREKFVPNKKERNHAESSVEMTNLPKIEKPIFGKFTPYKGTALTNSPNLPIAERTASTWGAHGRTQARNKGRFVQRAPTTFGSPPLAPTSLEKENLKNKSSSTAEPATPCPDGSSSWLLNNHPARLAWRRMRAEQRRTERRVASCEFDAHGHVGGQLEAKCQNYPQTNGKPGLKKRGASQSTTQPLSKNLLKSWTSSTATKTSTDSSSICNAPSATKSGGSANATMSAAFAQREQMERTADVTVSTKKSWACQELKDEQLLSPETLALLPTLPAFLRESHRRTGRMMALQRLREGKPAWETEEERNAVTEPHTRASEAECRGFRKAPEMDTPGPRHADIPPVDLTPLPDDHLPADVFWLRTSLGMAPELSRLCFRPEARSRYPRSVWRAAVAKLISRHKFQVHAPVAYLVSAAEEMAKPGAHDNRTAKFYSVTKDWSPSLRAFARVEARAPGWLRQYGGRDDWY